MKTINPRRSVLVFGIALGIILSGCGLLGSSKPVAVIAAPPSGTQVDMNTEVQVQVKATDDQGIVRIDLLANGTVVATETSPQAAGQPTFSAVLRYTPKTSGAQVIEVRAYNRKGDASTPVSINLQVRDAQALATGTPATFPSLTPLPSNPTAITPTSAAPATSAPPAPPPAITIVMPTSEPPPSQQPTVPAAPAAPSAFNANGTGTTIAFTWNDNSLNETGFRIYQIGQVAPVVPLGAHGATGGMAYNWVGRPCNVSATYYIRAYNDAGESASSNTNSAVTLPCAPTGFTASPASQSSISFSFTDNATNESGFHLYRQGLAAALQSYNSVAGTGVKIAAFNPVICGQNYTYSARAYNAAGESSSSNTNDAKTSACTVTVTFTSILLREDTDTDNDAEVWLDIDVEGTTRRWPSSGTTSINKNETKAIAGVSVAKAMDRTNNLTVRVKGADLDIFPPGTDDLGTALQTYSGASTWSEGNRCDESASPNYFRICYTIAVTP